MGERTGAPVLAPTLVLGWVTQYRESVHQCPRVSPITHLSCPSTRAGSCTRGVTAASGHAPRRFPGALFNTLHLSITFLKSLVPPLSAGLLMLEMQCPIYLPAAGRVSTPGCGTRGEIPTPAPSASTNPCLPLNPQLWPKCEAEPGVAAKNEVCPSPVEGARRCCSSPPRATSGDTELRSLSCWSSACRRPRAEVSAAGVCGTLGQPRFPSKFGLSSSRLSAVVCSLVMSLVGAITRRQQTLPGASTDAYSQLSKSEGR